MAQTICGAEAGATVQQVREYSPTLADKVALVPNEAGDQKSMFKDAPLKILKTVRPDLITEDSAEELDGKIQVINNIFELGPVPLVQ